MEIIVHCSDSEFGNAILIDKWHRQNGWSGNGYHLVIINGRITSKVYNKHLDGFIETARPFDDNRRIDGWETGAHTRGKNNRIGICLIGKSGKFTPKQIDSLLYACLLMKEQFGKVHITQHSDHDPRKPYCAGLSQSFIDNLNLKVNHLTIKKLKSIKPKIKLWQNLATAVILSQLPKTFVN